MTMRIVPETATEEMQDAGMEDAPLYPEQYSRTGAHTGKRVSLSNRDCGHLYSVMLAASPSAGRVSREMLKVGLRARYGAPENYEPSVQAMEGAAKFVAALGLEMEPTP